MFWKRKPKASSNAPKSEILVSFEPAISPDTFDAWVEAQNHQVVHDLLVRAALRLLPGLFADSTSIQNPAKFDRSLHACYPIVHRGFLSQYDAPSVRGVMNGSEFYNIYPGAADGGVSYTAFHFVESVADARMPEVGRFNKRYLCEVNNNLKFAMPDDHAPFFGALAQDGIALSGATKMPEDRMEIMKAPLWHSFGRPAYFSAGIAKFNQHISSSEVGSQIIRDIEEFQII